MPTGVNSAAFGIGHCSSDLMRWLVMPISPRRYQPPKSQPGGGGAYIAAAAAIEGMSAANATVEISECRTGGKEKLNATHWLRPFGR